MKQPDDRYSDMLYGGNIARREFLALSAGAVVAAALRPAFGPGMRSAGVWFPDLVETNVNITTPDGVCDAVFVHPKGGSHPGVLVWPDVFGLRPAMVDIGKRLAAQGYSVLVPNPFYRVGKTPFPDASKVDFKDSTDMKKMQVLMTAGHAPGNVEKDAPAHIAFLDAQKEVDAKKKIGVQGYCMGGPMVVRTAAAVPDRVGAGASFHGGGLVTDGPDSPHLLAPKIKAQMYFAIAANDDEHQPDAKDKLKAAFPNEKAPAGVEVYPGTLHGWCVPDMPVRDGKPIYSKADAERAWGKLSDLYRTSLV
jgi:carboxymethylenebutenolidase